MTTHQPHSRSDKPNKHIRSLAEQLNAMPVSGGLVHHTPRAHAAPKPKLKAKWLNGLVIVLVAILLLLGLYQAGPKLIAMFTDTVHVTGDIGTDTVWHADRTYVLTTDIFVHNNARLTLEPGTLVKGKPGSSLVVARGSQIIAEGRPEAPIVFTSSQPAGSRVSGDWGGLVLLGEDRTNKAFTRVEGVDSRDIRGQFGGQVEQGSCGTLRYVRIEYAGFEAFPDNELNGLTLGGCGPQTDISYVQVHRALDDGIELFGGSTNLHHILITGARDDSLDWDLGWDGKIQFLIAHQYPGTGDNAFEGDNSPHRDNARPRSNPLISNITLVGEASRHRAMVLRTGTAGQFHNVLLAGYQRAPIDLRGSRTTERVNTGDLGFVAVRIDGSLAPAKLWPIETGEEDNDTGFNESVFFSSVADTVPGLMPQPHGSPYPDFRPNPDRASLTKVGFPDASSFWDTSARYPGAVDPHSTNPWYLGWTDFSES